MFSGIGGFELGIQRAIDYRGSSGTSTLEQLGNKSDFDPSDGQRGRTDTTCVGYSEIDKYAIKVYERNFNGHKNYEDATTINPKQLPDFDLLVGGFPCQAFSIAGKRAGFDDTRGTLFFDIARILKHKRPPHLVLENVKGLLSHDGGKTFSTIIGVLTDLGYVVEWQVLNSKNFGVPQNRERVFIVGHLRGKCRAKVFPIIGNNGQAIKNIGYLNSPTWQKRTDSSRRVYQPEDGIAPTIPTGTGGGVMPKIVTQRGRDNGQQLESRADDNTNTVTSVQKDYLVANTVDANYYKGINRNPGHASSNRAYEINGRIRRLTPRECERLQGFPDDWTRYDQTGGVVSDTQRYKMCGNAVTVNVVTAVFNKLDRCLV